MKKAVFITATGTDIGKTYLSKIILKKLLDSNLSIGYYKPIMSGVEYLNGEIVSSDLLTVAEYAGINLEKTEHVSYCFEEALSPHLAAKRKNIKIELSKLTDDFMRLSNRFDYLIVEGCGGIAAPISYDDKKIFAVYDLIKYFNLPAVIVAGSEVGTINHTFLTAQFARSNAIDLRGVIMNRYDEKSFLADDNATMIEVMSSLPIITKIAAGGSINIEADELRKKIF